jgi:hypothetical protein
MSPFWHVLKEQLARIRGWLGRRAFEGDFDEEVKAHLAFAHGAFCAPGFEPG